MGARSWCVDAAGKIQDGTRACCSYSACAGWGASMRGCHSPHPHAPAVRNLLARTWLLMSSILAAAFVVRRAGPVSKQVTGCLQSGVWHSCMARVLHTFSCPLTGSRSEGRPAPDGGHDDGARLDDEVMDHQSDDVLVVGVVLVRLDDAGLGVSDEGERRMGEGGGEYSAARQLSCQEGGA